MADDNMFHLRLNGFENTISTTWRKLRNEKDFCDVTLACDDNQIQSHKIILSSCSPVLKNLLKQNQHNHPMLYLRGVAYSELVSLLDFMYQGEVNIANDDLNSFLALAQDLKIQGLATDHVAEQIANNSEPEVQIKYDDEGTGPPKKKRRKYIRKEKCNQPNANETPYCLAIKSENMENVKESGMIPIEMEDSYPNDNMMTMSSAITFDEHSILNAVENQNSIEQLQLDKKRNLDTVYEGNLLQFLCDHCDYKSPRRNNLTQHMESVHEGVRYPCDYCEYKATKRHYLKTHIRKKHVEYLDLF